MILTDYVGYGTYNILRNQLIFFVVTDSTKLEKDPDHTPEHKKQGLFCHGDDRHPNKVSFFAFHGFFLPKKEVAN